VLVERTVMTPVSCSVCVAVAFWVREALITLVLVMDAVRTLVPVLLVALEVTVWVEDLVPVLLPELLRVAVLVWVAVNGAVTGEVPLALTQISTILQGWLSAQIPALVRHALFMMLRGGLSYASVGGRIPPQSSSP
jgi:hypothetical protein